MLMSTSCIFDASGAALASFLTEVFRVLTQTACTESPANGTAWLLACVDAPSVITPAWLKCRRGFVTIPVTPAALGSCAGQQAATQTYGPELQIAQAPHGRHGPPVVLQAYPSRLPTDGGGGSGGRGREGHPAPGDRVDSHSRGARLRCSAGPVRPSASAEASHTALSNS